MQSGHSLERCRLAVNFLHGFRPDIGPTKDAHQLKEGHDSRTAVPGRSPFHVVIQLLKQLLQPNKQTNPFIQRKFVEDHVIQGKSP